MHKPIILIIGINEAVNIIYPILLTAVFSYYFSVRQSKINREIEFSREVAKDVELIFSEINRLTSNFQTHVNYLRKQNNKELDSSTIDLTIQTKNDIYDSYIKLKSIEYRINNYKNYVHSKYHLEMISKNTHCLWKEFDYISNRAQVRTMKAETDYSLSLFLFDAAPVLMECSLYRYNTHDLFCFLDEISSRRVLFIKVINRVKYIFKKLFNKIKSYLPKSKPKEESVPSFDLNDELIKTTDELMYDDPENAEMYRKFIHLLRTYRDK